MMKFFKKRQKPETETAITETYDPIVCRVKVFNPSISEPIAEVDYKKSEMPLLNEYRWLCASAGYRVEIVSY